MCPSSIEKSKKNKLENQDPLYLLYCRLGYVNKIRITKWYKKKYFYRLDYESYKI
jgi:hypothetical protein